MKKLIVIAICNLVLLSVADAFQFRGFNYEWGAKKSTVIKNESKAQDSNLSADRENMLTYVIDSKAGHIVAVYFFKEDALNSAGYYFDMEGDKFKVYQRLKKGYENTYGSPFEQDQHNSYFESDDAGIGVMYQEKKDGVTIVAYNPKEKSNKKKTASKKYEKLSFIDFMLDYKKLKGKKVAISGYGTYMIDSFMFGAKELDPSSVVVDIEGVPRKQRKFILTKCGHSCKVTVYGTVNDVNYMKGIVADKITRK